MSTQRGIAPFIYSISTNSGIEYLFPNGTDLDVSRMDEMKLTDKQRDIALRLSEKRRRLILLQQRLVVGEDAKSSRGDIGLDLNAFDDAKIRPVSVRSNEKSFIMKQVGDIETEVEDLTSSLLVSLGLDVENESRRVREEQRAKYDSTDMAEGEMEDFFDLTLKTDTSEYPEIPAMDRSENIESVESKLAYLNALRVQSEGVLSGLASEKRLNEIANEDEEVDPLDAFMAANSVDLASQEIDKTEQKLDKIKEAILRFEKIRAVLSKNQFSDSRISVAIEQRNRVEEKRRIDASRPPTRNRGEGSVWEEEFRADESVPKRVRDEKLIFPAKKPVELNLQVGGLQLMGPDRDVHERAEPVEEAVRLKLPSESSLSKQEELRKRLGY